jgi:hypothetical protein
MQPSDQEPSEKIQPEEEAAQVAQAPYAFSSEHKARRVESDPKGLPDTFSVSSEEMVAPGVSYPPTPEYYEQMPAVVEKTFQLPILPPRPPQPLPVTPLSYATTHPQQSPPLAVPSPVKGSPNQHNYYAYPAPTQRAARRGPNKWAWIMIIVLGVLLLSSCGLVVWSFSNWVSPTVQQLFNGMQTTNDYYDALQARNDVAAYRMLALQGKQQNLTQSQFIQQAQVADEQNGIITDYTVGQPTLGSNNTDTGTNVTEFSVQVNVTRGRQQYTANLDLKLIGGTWKIVSYDRL